MFNRKYEHLYFRIDISINVAQEHIDVCGCHVTFVADPDLAVDQWTSNWGVFSESLVTF